MYRLRICRLQPKFRILSISTETGSQSLVCGEFENVANNTVTVYTPLITVSRISTMKILILLALDVILVSSLTLLFDDCIVGEPSMKIYGLSLIACVGKCRCTDCEYVSYNRMLPLCKLFEKGHATTG